MNSTEEERGEFKSNILFYDLSTKKKSQGELRFPHIDSGDDIKICYEIEVIS